MNKTVLKIANKLYSEDWNMIYTSKEFWNELNITPAEWDNTLRTSSLHENYIEWKELTSMWYMKIELTRKGVVYIKELRLPLYRKLVHHFNKLSGFYSVLIAFIALIISLISIYISTK